MRFALGFMSVRVSLGALLPVTASWCPSPSGADRGFVRVAVVRKGGLEPP